MQQFEVSRSVTGTVALVVAFGFVVIGCSKSDPPAPAGSVGQAMEFVRQGDTAAALSMLETIAAGDPKGRIGNEAALMLGNLLIGAQQHAKAVSFLERAERGTEAQAYARLLLVRAIVEGGVVDKFGEAAEKGEALAHATAEEVSALVREEAGFLLTRVYTAQKAWAKASERGTAFLTLWPASRRASDVRWMTAEALDRQERTADAYDQYATIWYSSPSSAWAKQAHERVVDLEKRGGVNRRELTGPQRYEFVRALQVSGLHADAIDQAETYRAQAGSAGNQDGALYLQAVSLAALSKNDDCVRLCQQIRTAHPQSKWAPSAGTLAIQVLRRNDNEPQIRQWVSWLRSQHAGHPKAIEALYALGVFLQNTGKEDEGLSLLEQLVSESPHSAIAEDALWKAAWGYRKRGDTVRAVSLVAQLLDQFPKSGFRKAALYWQARFSADTDPSGAKERYLTLLREFPNDYYGHEALKNLLAVGGTPGQIGDSRPFPKVDTLDSVQAGQDRSRALAVNLKKVGLYEFAAEELARVPGVTEDPSLQFAIADLYARSGRTMEAHTILSKHFAQFMVSGSRDSKLVPTDFWHTVYPYNYRGHIVGAIKDAGLDRAQIDPSLVAALIKLESRFFPGAISPVGAIGLMQLMPSTAAEIARERGSEPPSRADLFRPDINIRYGTYYLAQRVRDFKGDWFPAICSYNAGVGPVRRWWNEKPAGQPMDEFIESIPYLDTRLYIKQVLGDYRNYEWIYKQTESH
jgi:soluble lytic murein transglycosylase